MPTAYIHHFFTQKYKGQSLAKKVNKDKVSFAVYRGSCRGAGLAHVALGSDGLWKSY